MGNRSSRAFARVEPCAREFEPWLHGDLGELSRPLISSAFPNAESVDTENQRWRSGIRLTSAARANRSWPERTRFVASLTDGSRLDRVAE